MSEKNKLEEALCFSTKSAAKVFSEEKKKEAFAFAEGYKSFLDAAKTEREAVDFALDLAKANGYKEFEYGKEYHAGDRVYYVNRNKAIIMANIGTKSPEEGFGIIASHVDAPRIDLKPNPLCEMESIAYFKTHYYGGIKKYQEVSMAYFTPGSSRCCDFG
jgi:aspartyl aminopeptidase